MTSPAPALLDKAVAVGRVLLGVLFLVSGVSKLLNMGEFYQAVAGYKMLPPELTVIAARLMPWVETLSGLYLALGLFTRWALGVVAVMTLCFCMAIGIVLWRGDLIDCGCFIGGGAHSKVSIALLLRDIGLLAAAVWMLRYPRHCYTVDGLLARRGNAGC